MSLYSLGDNSCGIRKCSAVGLHFLLPSALLGLLPGLFDTTHQYAFIEKHFVSSFLVYSCFYVLIWDNPSSNPLHMLWFSDFWGGFVFKCITPRGGPTDMLLHCMAALHTRGLSQGWGRGGGVVLFTDMMSFIVTLLMTLWS